MFDALLGRKFMTKCKHSIKCIYERLKPIRNRKQAVVNILRKDIADILRNGDVDHAFGRMDELIIEMNRLACYDMIEKFCETVLIQLPLLQKNRESPPEDREAVSTLIFAAARFPDLPELCDLRQLFTMRYGSDIETSVNPEFKDKSASRAFSAARKLQLMKNIACEFSVNWDSESFEYKINNPTASKFDQPIKREAPQNAKALPVREKDGAFKHVVTKARDIHVISHEPEPTRKINPWADEPENVKPSPIACSNPHEKPEKDKFDSNAKPEKSKFDSHAKPEKDKFDPLAKPEKDKYANCTDDGPRYDTYRASLRAREVLDPINQDKKVVEQRTSVDDCKDRSRVPPHMWEQNGTEADYQGDAGTVCKRSFRRQMMVKPNGEGGNVMEQYKPKDDSRVRHVVPPVVQQESYSTDARESHDVVYRRPSRTKMDNKAELKQAVGQQEFEDNDKPRVVPHYSKPKDVINVLGSDFRVKDVHERTGKARQETYLAAEEGGVVDPQKPNNSRAFNMIPPPYVKPAVSKAGSNSEHPKASSQPTHEGVFATGDKPPSPPTRGTFAASVKSNNGGYRDLPNHDLVADDEMPKPRSVRRKQQKPPVAQEVDTILPVPGDEPVPQIPHGHRRRSSRQSTFAPQEGFDEEEMFMDKLLMQYSKKGTPEQSTRHRMRAQALPADHTLHEGEAGQYETNGRHLIQKAETAQAAHPGLIINNEETREQQYYRRHRTPKAELAQALPAHHALQDGEAVLHQAYSRYRVQRPEPVHPPERAISLPPDSATPKRSVTPREMVRGPIRATSMQPDSPSTPGGRIHVPLPDYDELAARFAALKKG